MKKLAALEYQSTADRVAGAIREQIIDEEDGAYIGSESSLAESLNVSPPTLRQAARMLEHEQILLIKPGKGGGYFCRRPDMETVTNSAALFLRNRDTPNKMVNDAIDSIMGPIISAAVKCRDPALRAELEQLSSKSDLKRQPVNEAKFRHDATELLRIFAQMSGNLFFEIFCRILFNEIYVSKLAESYILTDELLKKDQDIRIQWADAVLERDEAKALRIRKKRSSLFRSWPQKE